MKIELKEITIAELTNGYEDHAEAGVIGYGGKLDIRPPYQREFIYKEQQRNAVIDTVLDNFPLNVMYWSVNDDGYELIDGQQRTLSICQYVNGDFSHKGLYFHSHPDDIQKKILNYTLQIYHCTGTNSEKFKWFKTINIAGEKLTTQELRNATYVGTWVADAKKYFSKTACPAYQIGNKYLKGSPIRQDYLETVIDWVSDGKIEDYMAKHQHDNSAKELWDYFENVMNWVKKIYPKHRREMKGVEWGVLYNQHKDKKLDPDKLEKEVKKLMQDDDITKLSGIYNYLLDGKEKHLNIRAFTDNQKRQVYEKQNGKCKKCKKPFDIKDMEADHIKPWHAGGKTEIANCQMLCKEHNREKSGK